MLQYVIGVGIHENSAIAIRRAARHRHRGIMRLGFVLNRGSHCISFDHVRTGNACSTTIGHSPRRVIRERFRSRSR